MTAFVTTYISVLVCYCIVNHIIVCTQTDSDREKRKNDDKFSKREKMSEK